MAESELRELIANNIQAIEPGLTLLDKERYIPHPLGTRSFIDIYAKDIHGHHVLIELKSSDASAREALHEIHKYVEGVKQHFGAHDQEIRVFVVSTEWAELLVPFSRFVADTKLAVTGLQISVNEKSRVVMALPVSILPISQGRFISPWHDVNWYLNQASLDKGITAIEACCRVKLIEDYVIVVLQPPQPLHSEHQAAMRTAIQQMAAARGNVMLGEAPDLPSYQYIAYSAMQALTRDQSLHILERDPAHIDEVRELINDMDSNEALQFLHESVTTLEPRPEQDHYEIGYPAKFTKFLDAYQCNVQSVRRYGMFARNILLDDATILSELRGEGGSTGQRFKRTLVVHNQAHMASARHDLAICLEQNPVWRSHILRALDEIQQEFPQAEVDISVYNPATGVLTLYFATTRENGFLYVPMYSVVVRNPQPVRIYYGGLQADGAALTFRQILNKYYEGQLWGLLLTMTWGGHESRDTDIIEDLGAAYRSFRCDIDGASRDFFVLRDERWRPCRPMDILKVFGDYLGRNERLVRRVVKEIGTHSTGGLIHSQITS